MSRVETALARRKVWDLHLLGRSHVKVRGVYKALARMIARRRVQSLNFNVRFVVDVRPSNSYTVYEP